MKVERQLYKASFKNMFWYFLLQFVLINIIVLIYNILSENQCFTINNIAILFQFVLPVINAVIYETRNRSGILKVSGYSKANEIKEIIELAMKIKGLTKTEISKGHDLYLNTSEKSRIYNFFFLEKITIKYNDNNIMVLGKKNALQSLEMKLNNPLSS